MLGKSDWLFTLYAFDLCSEVEHDLEVEKRKARETLEATKMKDKEYQKLKV